MKEGGFGSRGGGSGRAWEATAEAEAEEEDERTRRPRPAAAHHHRRIDQNSLFSLSLCESLAGLGFVHFAMQCGSLDPSFSLEPIKLWGPVLFHSAKVWASGLLVLACWGLLVFTQMEHVKR